MRRLLLLLLILTAPALGFTQTEGGQPSTVKLGAGAIPVKLRLTQTLSSANAKVGQAVTLEVVDPVEVNGKVVIAAGAYAQGAITPARRRGRNHREGQLQFTVLTVREVDGSEARVQSATVQKGTGQGEPIFGPCTFPFPADPVGLFQKGQDVVIPKGTELTTDVASPQS